MILRNCDVEDLCGVHTNAGDIALLSYLFLVNVKRGTTFLARAGGSLIYDPSYFNFDPPISCEINA